MSETLQEARVRVHREACGRSQQTYLDPESGMLVISEYAHRSRGFCCGSACRHCPYHWQVVPTDRFADLEIERERRRANWSPELPDVQ